MATNTNKLKLTGVSFGKLTVIKEAPKLPTSHKTQWLCMCECGAERVVTGTELTGNRVTSCGCEPHKNTIHGMENTPEYAAWLNMKQRCYNKNNHRYDNYGKRGIIVCDKWKNSFVSFYADMGNKPSPTQSIDRINNDGNYESSNCRWATHSTQANNKQKRKDGNLVSGVSYCKTHNKWVSRVNMAGKRKSLGYFKDWFEAVCARKSAEGVAEGWTY